MVCRCNEYIAGVGYTCLECQEKNKAKEIEAQLSQHVAVTPQKIVSVEKFVSDFIMEMKSLCPDIGHVMVVFDNVELGNTLGMGNITGINDMNRCVSLLENYVEILRAGIPKLH